MSLGLPGRQGFPHRTCSRAGQPARLCRVNRPRATPAPSPGQYRYQGQENGHAPAILAQDPDPTMKPPLAERRPQPCRALLYTSWRAMQSARDGRPLFHLRPDRRRWQIIQPSLMGREGLPQVDMIGGNIGFRPGQGTRRRQLPRNNRLAQPTPARARMRTRRRSCRSARVPGWHGSTCGSALIFVPPGGVGHGRRPHFRAVMAAIHSSRDRWLNSRHGLITGS